LTLHRDEANYLAHTQGSINRLAMPGAYGLLNKKMDAAPLSQQRHRV
jgi:hypothetical protein